MWNWVKHRIRRKVEPVYLSQTAFANNESFTFTSITASVVYVFSAYPDWRYAFRGGGCE